jgi:hypothetical protein
MDEMLKDTQDEKLRPFVELARRVLELELTVLPGLKGKAEATLRAVIWQAHDAVKGLP